MEGGIPETWVQWYWVGFGSFLFIITWLNATYKRDDFIDSFGSACLAGAAGPPMAIIIVAAVLMLGPFWLLHRLSIKLMDKFL